MVFGAEFDRRDQQFPAPIADTELDAMEIDLARMNGPFRSFPRFGVGLVYWLPEYPRILQDDGAFWTLVTAVRDDLARVMAGGLAELDTDEDRSCHAANRTRFR
jgi:hypothetical protein